LSSFGRGLRRRAERARIEAAKRRAREERIAQREVTYWNGEPTPCRRVRILVAYDEQHPGWISNRFAGSERDAVEVSYGDDVFYIDDEGYELTDDDRELLERHARALAEGGSTSLEMARIHFGVTRDRSGYRGWGWAKVTTGRGSPRFGHVTLLSERVIAERE
jgi:hypothetical protein